MPFDRDEVMSHHGKRIAYADTLAGSYTTVFGTVDINLPERELEEEEVTNDDSADYTKDFEPGLYDPGSASFTYKYQKTQYTALETLFQLATVPATRVDATKFWKVTLVDGSTAIFQGYLKTHNLPLEGATVPTVDAEIRVKGKVTWAAGA
jgi:hypothetical protein